MYTAYRRPNGHEWATALQLLTVRVAAGDVKLVHQVNGYRIPHISDTHSEQFSVWGGGGCSGYEKNRQNHTVRAHIGVMKLGIKAIVVLHVIGQL